MMKLEDLPKILDKVKTGYSIRFGKNNIETLINHPMVDYSSWENEKIGGYDFA